MVLRSQLLLLLWWVGWTLGRLVVWVWLRSKWWVGEWHMLFKLLLLLLLLLLQDRHPPNVHLHVLGGRK